MISSNFVFRINYLSRVDSTNSYALKIIGQKGLKAGQVYWTNQQEKGKGQRGATWQSEQGKNLLFSLVLEPNVAAQDQFSISQCVALGMKRALDRLSVEGVCIKWPNDILIEKKKVAGILIENQLEGEHLKLSVVGIGININQKQFGKFNREAVSLSQVLGKNLNLEEMLSCILRELKSVLSEASNSTGLKDVKTEYLNALYGYAKSIRLKDSNGLFQAKVESILPSGKIQVRRDGVLKAYDLKEIQFID